MTQLDAYIMARAIALYDMVKHNPKVRTTAAELLMVLTAEYIAQSVVKPAPDPFELVDGYLTQEEINYLRQGQKINAIKAYRTRTGFSLLDSKNNVETHGNQYLPDVS